MKIEVGKYYRTRDGRKARIYAVDGGGKDMEDQQLVWIKDPKTAWEWAMGWVDEAKSGSHSPVRRIHEAASNFKDRFWTNGLWCPGAEVVYDYLREAADMAQANYEDAQPGMESGQRQQTTWRPDINVLWSNTLCLAIDTLGRQQ